MKIGQKKERFLNNHFRFYKNFLNRKDHYHFCEFILEIKNYFKNNFSLKFNIIKGYFRNYSFFNLMVINFTGGVFFSIIKNYIKKKKFTNLKLKLKIEYNQIKKFGKVEN